ncbi:acyl-CoA dehydrogenase family protein [Oceanobacillus alkalisoli]|uniref:acyl-CoA dehydrogenase family protein n=1 Tax=Oceanobacillus alkalisoli TaxID=2925113 RepID=UPI001EEFFF18|nr:acyl-CoA dehydrogenase family protein [Oceanobacillus alkalisoli]MCF3942844.1 acyl-CoA/acyl-ACP dehydrogenase [Oceanobacillus alkalisoli]MCG5102432.1 acyl-CoA/acyl-ACP dehydrogenase [Oceanobacillus alkalisoli]
MKITELQTMEKRADLLRKTVAPFTDRAAQHDRDSTFPHENFDELKNIGYPALTLPKKYGGSGISLSEMLYLQAIIGKADGSTALSIGWHMGIMKHLGENNIWDENKFASVAKDVVATGSLLNNAASEPATGSPTRGGKPETYAKETQQGWVINGRKTFTTLAPVLDYFVVSASIDGTDDIGNFLVQRENTGVSIDETWDSIAMRATGSHDLVLENVHVEKDDLVEKLTGGKRKATGWLLHIPACYLGIARAAQDYANHFARNYSPNSITGTISDLPNVKQKMGEMELAILESKHFLFSVARKWDESDESIRQTMGPELGAVKLSVVNKALHVVDLAMRIVGARSLSEKNPLQRYYRDVRAGLHNPPMDDMTIMNLANLV